MFFKRVKQKKLSKNMQEFIKQLEDNINKEMKKHIDKRNIFPMCTDAQLVVNCLCDLFLGEDWWYVTDPLCNGQVNTIILDNILYKYCPEYRKYIESKKKGR